MAVDKKDDGRLGKLDLSKKLEISRPTLDKYFAMEGAPKPDEDGRYEVVPTLDFIRSQSDKAAPTAGIAGARERKINLECEKLLLVIESEKLNISIAKGEHISKTDASAIITPLMTELGAMLRQKFEIELPSQYTGKTLIEREQLNAAAVDFIINRIRTGTRRLREDEA